jgi:lipopolysaccharide biosynthesis glycosyltransferase
MGASKAKVYVGYDSREDIAWRVCRNSLLRHCKRPLDVYPLKQQTIRELGLYTRAVDPKATTEFSLTRFLSPYLAASKGWAVFVDCDFLFTGDIYELLDSLDPNKAVHVVQHDYEPSQTIKMDGKQQTIYPRKNWSSFMVFNGAHPAIASLTPETVNSQTPAYLHRLTWAPDEAIGSLDREWNFLVGEYPKPGKTPKAIHFTNGGPWFENWQGVDYADLWWAEHDLLLLEREAAE